MDDKDAYREVKDDFEMKFKEVETLPDRLNDAVDPLKWLSPTMYLYVTSKRDDVQEDLKRILAKLKEVAEGISAPFLFIDYAANWQDVGSRVSKANNAQGNPLISLEGHWEGKAYTRFKASREQQSAAMTTMSEISDQIHTELLSMAEEGRNFYKQIADKLATLLAQVGTALVEIATVVGSPWGIQTFGTAIVTGIEFIEQTITSFFELQAKVVISSNELESVIKHPPGIPSGPDGQDSWPASTATEFDDKEDWKLVE